MAGQIFLISCLLATCLPIIFVQLPRLRTVKGLRAENKVATRSEILRRRSLSPSEKTLRRIARPWSKPDVDIAGAESEQEQIDPEEIVRPDGGRRWHTSCSHPIFGADASADRGASSKVEEVRTARAGKKPWDPPFRRQPPRTELIGKTPEGQWHSVADASPRRKTGREMEARGLAMRLFPPDPVADDVKAHDERALASSELPQTPQEPLYRRPPSKNHLQSHDNERGASAREHQPQPPLARNTPSRYVHSESLPSPLDGSPLASRRHAPRETLSEDPHLQGSLPSMSNDALRNVLNVTQEAVPKEVPKEAYRVSKIRPKFGLPLWQILSVTMGSLVFILVFALLVAHCLAWFLVYKTEARLGEVRSGLLRGGEMKLCLCGRG